MPLAARTFRVFVSSTFEDLREERNALQRDVFPRLRRLCEQHGARFQAIDLRWGVRDEAALDQQTLAICLREIRRCQATGVPPNFIVLLGDRYGWQPLPAEIPETEFKKLWPRLPAAARPLAFQWYRLDENAVPPEFRLQPRTGEFVTPAAWNRVERALREDLAKAAREAGLPEADLIKYGASATHQEILAGLGQIEADLKHVFGFFRRPDGESDARLEELKATLRERLPGNIVEFEAGNLAGLCDAVFRRLHKVVESEVKRFEDRPALELEVEAHSRFAEERSRVFYGRQAELDAIAAYIRGPERRPLMLFGESGSGKSAVMAKASRQQPGPGRAIRRFIGVSPESASGHALLTSLCREIGPGETPADYAQLERTFKDRLSVATPEQPLILFIDALDQLGAGDPAREATWLPAELPPHVKVIVSTTAKEGRLPEGLAVTLDRMAQSEGMEALDQWLKDARRTLQPWQRERVLACFERCCLPLYLKLAAEESILWQSYASRETCWPGEGIEGVLDTLFDRLAKNENHGATLVARSLGFLAAARYGLREDEMLDILTADDAVWDDFDQRKRHEVSERCLPVVVWARLSLDLEPYLAERAAPGGTVIGFYHRQLAERVAARFLADSEWLARHAGLAGYFSAQPAWFDEERRAPNARRAVELPFQQCLAQQWEQAEETLLDVQFLFAKVAAGMALDLDADYHELLHESSNATLQQREALEVIWGAVRLSCHVIAHDPAQLASQLAGRVSSHREPRTVRQFMTRLIQNAPRAWLRPRTSSLTATGGSLERVLAGHTGSVESVAVSPDGKMAISAGLDNTVRLWHLESGREVQVLAGKCWGGIHAVAVTPDGKLAISGSHDGMLEVWKLRGGERVALLFAHSDPVNSVAVTPDGKLAISASADGMLQVRDVEDWKEEQGLEGHSALVNSVAVLPDGKLALSASDDMTIKVWDLGTRKELRTLAGHTSLVSAVAVIADGKQVVSASGDGTLRVWDLGSGEEVRTMLSRSGYFTTVAVTPDGKQAISAATDYILRVWDLGNGREVEKLGSHAGRINGLAVTPNGKQVISASCDKTLKVWNLGSGKRFRRLPGHTELVSSIAVTPDGKQAVSASFDKTLKLWNVASGKEVRAMVGHTHMVEAVVVTPDGKQAISAADDMTLRVWDLATGKEVRMLSGHTSMVCSVAITADGKQVVSGSFDNTLKVWDLAGGKEVRTLDGHTDAVKKVELTPDGKFAVSASEDWTQKVWELETGRAIWTQDGQFLCGTAVAVSPDGSFAISPGANHTLRVWNLRDGREIRSLEGHASMIEAIVVTPDARLAISASWDGTLKAWDLSSGAEVRTFGNHADPVKKLALSPDGNLAISASDKTLTVWEVSSGNQVASFTADGAVTSFAHSPSDGAIIAGDAAGRMHFLSYEE